MGYVSLVGNAHVLRTWIQVGYLNPYFMFHINFLTVLAFKMATGKIGPLEEQMPLNGVWYNHQLGVSISLENML